MPDHNEHDLEEYILKNPDLLGVERWLCRQIHLPFGIADLLGLMPDGNWLLVELKSHRGSENAVLQVVAYGTQLDKIRDTMYPDGNGPQIIRAVVMSSFAPGGVQLAAHVLGVRVYDGLRWNNGVITGPDAASRVAYFPENEDREKRSKRTIERIREGYQNELI
jgi:hypothetical protein